MIATLAASFGVLMLAQSAPPPPALDREPGIVRDMPADARQCACDEAGQGDGEIVGVVADAELVLSADGRTASERQATVFSVIDGGGLTDADRIRIFHSTDEKKCGVTFSYGSRYTVSVRRADEELETDYCLMR